MKYRDLIQFDPIETVIQLRGAERAAEAAHLVSTYVISNYMAERIVDIVVPNLQFTEPKDQRGLLVVGNYGTGKSHLLALLSAVAENAELVELVRNDKAREASRAIAGQFKVIRMEIGSTEMRLRDIVVGEIEEALSEWGVDYQFPSMLETSNTKDPIVDMMVEFQKVFPDSGLLIVVDELLDYLRSRDEQALVLDLGFLREIGEVCRDTRVRFIGGVQESLFDSPSFQFVASAVGRVKARFDQVRIAREDVAYVVTERLLRKTPQQRSRVKEYLEQFSSLYPEMVEKVDGYVSLFPVHPAYIDTFEAIHVVEKREVLKTLSREMSQRLEEELPTSYPGLIAYDSYWKHLSTDPGFRSIPSVREVIDRSAELDAKIESGFTRRHLEPLAHRIISALSVQRLTVLDLRSPIGVTAAELRDDLCLHTEIPEEDPEFLAQTIETTLREISRTVSGQYLSRNPDNGQWYLDIDKHVDHDAIIEQRAATLSPNQLDRAFYDVLARLMEVTPDNAYVSGSRIWEYEVTWTEKKVTRPGYLFFGSPNQRSTAQPPQEFYLYFVQPYDPVDFKDDQLPDEVFFRLRRRDAEFDEWMRRYAAAMALAETSSTEKQAYRDKASSSGFGKPGYLQRIVQWLQDNMMASIDVTYRGRTTPAGELVTGRVASFREMVDQVASRMLAGHFSDRLPEYPAFSILITRDNRAKTAAEAVRGIVGPMRSRQATEVLRALELLDGDRISVEQSRYARHIRSELQDRGEGKVLNRGDIVESLYGGQVEYDRRFHLEPEWLAVVLIAMAYSGVISIQVPGGRIDASSADDALRTPIDTLVRFEHIASPRSLDTDALVALFTLLELSPGLILDPNAHEAAVKSLQKRVETELERVHTISQKASQGMPCWNAEIIEGIERDDLLSQLDQYRKFLDSLLTVNTVGKLKSFRHTREEIESHQPSVQVLRTLEQLDQLIGELQPVSSYLLQARTTLGEENPLSQTIGQMQREHVESLRNAERRSSTGARERLVREATALRAEYVSRYIGLHNRARLNIDEDRRKVALLESATMQRLRALRAIPILSSGALADIEQRLVSLRACTGLAPSQLTAAPVCPECRFRPDEPLADEPAARRLDAVEERLYSLERDWKDTLLQNLLDPTVTETLALVGADEKDVIDHFVRTETLPENVDGRFIRAMNNAFTELERVVVPRDDLVNALTDGGSPGTIDDLANRLIQFLSARTRGKDPSRVRIIVE